MKFQSLNPYSEKLLKSYEFLTVAEAENTLASADSAFHSWKQLSVPERGKYFERLASLLAENIDRLAEMASAEMGKPVKEAKIELQKCIKGHEFYIRHSAEFLTPSSSVIEDGREVTISYEPMGVILGIFPWNFPFWQVLRSAVPVVMGGNTMLIKPAPNVPQSSLMLQELFVKAGFPEGVLQTVFIDEKQIENMIADDRIKACTLTGSEKAGAAVASAAAKHIKKSVLELGGSDPFIVLPDADLDKAVTIAIQSRFQNNGQSCIAAKRFIVHTAVIDAFRQKLITAVSALRLGNPLDEDTNIGPLARKDLMEKLQQQVEAAVAAGATMTYRQENMPATGFFHAPMIIEKIPESSPVFKEELFGPVLSLYKAENEEEMIRIANATPFGLGGSVWGSDISALKRVAAQIQSGQVFVNSLVRSDPRFPFGGIKRSGFGRELGEQGLKEFCYVKTTWI